MSQTSRPPEVTEKNLEWEERLIPLGEPPKHEHYFEWRDGECKCRHCPYGLLGVVEIVNGRPR